MDHSEWLPVQIGARLLPISHLVDAVRGARTGLHATRKKPDPEWDIQSQKRPCVSVSMECRVDRRSSERGDYQSRPATGAFAPVTGLEKLNDVRLLAEERIRADRPSVPFYFGVSPV